MITLTSSMLLLNVLFHVINATSFHDDDADLMMTRMASTRPKGGAATGASAPHGGMVPLSDVPMRVVRGFVPTGATRFSATVRLCMLGAASVGKTSL
jgi:hypothetical protein